MGGEQQSDSGKGVLICPPVMPTVIRLRAAQEGRRGGVGGTHTLGKTGPHAARGLYQQARAGAQYVSMCVLNCSPGV